eukprot:scaffold8363_cov258-Pinguiococcus_pyrenoidosus.AAC.1
MTTAEKAQLDHQRPLALPGTGEGLPPDWEECVDPVSGGVFYANTYTGETSWYRPSEDRRS